MPTNPYEPPQEEEEASLPHIWRHMRDAAIVGAGAILGAFFCLSLCLPATSPPEPTVASFILAWLQGAAGAIVGGLIFSWSARYVHRPKNAK